MAREQSKVQPFPLPPRLPAGLFPGVEEFNKALRAWYEQLNGKLSLGTQFGAWSGHVDGELIELTTKVSATDFATPHNLGRVPVGVILLLSDADTWLFRLASTPAHTDSFVWFQTNAAAGAVFRILVF